MTFSGGTVTTSQELLFHEQQANVQLISSCEASTQRLQLLVCSNKYGFVIAADPARCLLQIFKSMEMVSANTLRGVKIALAPTQLDLSADELTLVVVGQTAEGPAAHLFDTRAFARLTGGVAPFVTLRLSDSADCTVRQVATRPPIENEPPLVVVVLSDGGVMVFEISETKKIVGRLPAGIKAKSVAWSRRGKQFVVGTETGKLIRHDGALAVKGCIEIPGDMSSILDVGWLDNNTFCCAVQPANNELEQPSLIKTPIEFTNFSDVCYGCEVTPMRQCSLQHLVSWQLLLVVSGSAGEVAILQFNSERQLFEHVVLDSNRAELPLNDDGVTPTVPVGVAITSNFSSDIKVSENITAPPSPLLYLLSNTGALFSYSVVNLKPGAKQLVEQPVLLTSRGERKACMAPLPLDEPTQGVATVFSHSSAVPPPLDKPSPLSLTHEPTLAGNVLLPHSSQAPKPTPTTQSVPPLAAAVAPVASAAVAPVSTATVSPVVQKPAGEKAGTARDLAAVLEPKGVVSSTVKQQIAEKVEKELSIEVLQGVLSEEAGNLNSEMSHLAEKLATMLRAVDGVAAGSTTRKTIERENARLSILCDGIKLLRCSVTDMADGLTRVTSLASDNEPLDTRRLENVAERLLRSVRELNHSVDEAYDGKVGMRPRASELADVRATVQRLRQIRIRHDKIIEELERRAEKVIPTKADHDSTAKSVLPPLDPNLFEELCAREPAIVRCKRADMSQYISEAREALKYLKIPPAQTNGAERPVATTSSTQFNGVVLHNQAQTQYKSPLGEVMTKTAQKQPPSLYTANQSPVVVTTPLQVKEPSPRKPTTLPTQHDTPLIATELHSPLDDLLSNPGAPQLVGSRPITAVSQLSGSFFGSVPTITTSARGFNFATADKHNDAGLLNTASVKPIAAVTGGSLFGSTTPTGGLFGALSTASDNTETSNVASLQPTVPVSNTTNEVSPGRTSVGNLFGTALSKPQPASSSPQTVATSKQSLFGTANIATTEPPTSELFDQKPPSDAPAGGIFGSTTKPTTTAIISPTPASAAATTQAKEATTAASRFSFTSPAVSAAATTSLFGTAKPLVTPSVAFTASAGLFGSTSPSIPTAASPTSSVGLFGAPAPTTTSSVGLFGAPAPTTTSSVGLFGPPAPKTTSSVGLFGPPTPKTTSSVGLFGAPAPTTTSSVGLFGSAVPAPVATTKPGLFGSTTTTAPTTATTSGLFGSTVPSTGLFGSTSPSTGAAKPATTSTGSIFGGFSAAGSSHAPATSGGIFGSTVVPVISAVKPSGGIFGTAAATTATSTGVFGSTALATNLFSTSSTGSIFGQQSGTPATTASLFGGSGDSAQSKGGLFGSVATSQASPAFSFGGAANTVVPDTEEMGDTNAVGSLFGSSFGLGCAPSSTASKASNPFGGGTTSTGGSVFGGTATSSAGSVFGGTAPASTGLFGKPATQSSVFGASQPATQASIFGGSSSPTSVFGTPAASTAFGGSPAFGAQTQSVFGGGAAFGSAAQPAFGGAVGFGASAAPTFGTSQRTFGSLSGAATGAPTTGFGSLAKTSPTQQTNIFGTGNKPASFTNFRG